MSSSRLFGVVAVLSSLSATPVLAQAVVQEPGYCAFFYPNANCQNKGPGNPYGNYQQPAAQPVKPLAWHRSERAPTDPALTTALTPGGTESGGSPAQTACGDVKAAVRRNHFPIAAKPS